MLLIIAHHHDAEARYFHDLLQSENRVNTRLLIPEALGVDYSISLHLKNDGRHHASIFFYETGFTLNCDNLCYAINRLSYINPLTWQHTYPVEKNYATDEINAFFPAFIHSLKCPVSNPIYNGSLYGEATLAEKWAGYFKRCYLPVHPLLFDTTGKIYTLLQNTPAENICRHMQIGNQLITPLQQLPAPVFSDLKKILLENGDNDMREFIFFREGSNLQLIQVSKVPSLSLYAKNASNIIYQQIKNTSYDIIDGHTQRNTCTVAC